jgi:hypothetical protein
MLSAGDRVGETDQLSLIASSWKYVTRLLNAYAISRRVASPM